MGIGKVEIASRDADQREACLPVYVKLTVKDIRVVWCAGAGRRRTMPARRAWLTGGKRCHKWWGRMCVRNFQRKVKGRWLIELYEFYLPLEVPGLWGIVEW